MAAEDVLIVGIVLMAFTWILAGLSMARRYKKVAPDEAMVIWGRRRGDRGYVVVTGGAKFIVPIVMSVRYMNIGANMLRFQVPDVMTRSGVPITVDAVGVFKISSEQEKLNVAAGQWLSKSPDEMQHAAREIIIGQIRGVCAKLEVEQINSERNEVGEAVRGAVLPHFANLGFDLLSFAVADIHDQNGYLEALGKQATAQVKRDAIIAEATARKQAVQIAAEQDVEAQRIRFKADAEIAAAQADRDAAIESAKNSAVARYARPK